MGISISFVKIAFPLSSLQNLNITNEILEQAMQLVTNDNIDLGFAVIEQVAADKVSC